MHKYIVKASSACYVRSPGVDLTVCLLKSRKSATESLLFYGAMFVDTDKKRPDASVFK